MAMPKRPYPEPPIVKTFAVTRNGKSVIAQGKIDTGASPTNLQRAIACELQPNMPSPTIVGETASGVVLGNVLEVKLRIGGNATKIKAYVPAVVLLPDGSRIPIEGKNL